MDKLIAFETFEQLVLWQSELCGQISDGNWENARPYEHYKPWGQATPIVDPAKPGRNFYAQKDNYNFTAPELLEVVGERMCYRAGLAVRAPEAVKQVLASGVRLPESDVDWHENAKDDWKQKYITEWRRAGLPETVTPLPLKHVREVLKRMKQIIRTYRA